MLADQRVLPVFYLVATEDNQRYKLLMSDLISHIKHLIPARVVVTMAQKLMGKDFTAKGAKNAKD